MPPVHRVRLRAEQERALLAVLEKADLSPNRPVLSKLLGRLRGRELARSRYADACSKPDITQAQA